MSEEFSYENVSAKRPSGGISPMRFPSIVGKKSKKIFNIDDIIEI